MDKGHVGWSLDFKAIPGLHGPVTKATIAILKQVQDARTAGWRAGVGAMREAFIADMKKSWQYELGQSIGTEIVKGKLAEASAWAIPLAEKTADRLLAEGEGGKK